MWKKSREADSAASRSAIVVAIGVVLFGLAACSDNSDAEEDRYAARDVITSHFLRTKIIVTNKQGRQSDENIEHINGLSPEFRFLDDQGYILDLDEMTSQQRSQYHNVIANFWLDLGGDHMMSESRRDVPAEIRDAAR